MSLFLVIVVTCGEPGVFLRRGGHKYLMQGIMHKTRHTSKLSPLMFFFPSLLDVATHVDC